MTISDLRRRAAELLPDTVQLRRTLHRHPEIGNRLPRTRETVLAALHGLPLEVHLHDTTSGIVAVLEGEGFGPSIILRGDMDALAMPEDTGLDFASEVEGAMHACGHDLHTAMLVGAAHLLSEHRAQLNGSVVFMFQPGEEGDHGARFMLDEGLLDVVSPRPTGAFALHVTSVFPAGTVNHRPGPQLASADELRITVRGRGGHASAPHYAADPVTVAAEIILAVQAGVTRQVNALEPAVVTFGHISAGTTHNVIPETAFLEGTMRTLAAETRSQVQRMVGEIAHHVAAAHGLTAELDITPGYPVTVNDADFAGLVSRVAGEVVGDEALTPMPHPIMGAEDWSYVLEQVPGVMAFLGACPRDLDPTTAPSNHSNRVVFDEAAMADGIALHAAVAMTHLNGGS